MASSLELGDLVQIDLTPKRPQRKPEWLKARAPMGDNYHALKKLARTLDLHTVCESDRKSVV
jgi:lipoic acid synthetase